MAMGGVPGCYTRTFCGIKKTSSYLMLPVKILNIQCIPVIVPSDIVPNRI